MSKALQELGLKTYHSEELSAFVWSKIADDHWSRPENGGRKSPLAHPFLTAAGAPESTSDLSVLEALGTEEFSAELSKCRPDALLFDGVEHLFWPSYHASPDAKIIMLNWRTWKEWSRSLEDFSAGLLLYTTFLGVFQCSGQGLPYGLLLKLVDPWLGHPVSRLLADGGPPFHAEYSVPVRLWHITVNVRRIMSHWFAGLRQVPTSEAEYLEVWEAARRLVPPERLFEWDMRRHGWEDLCRFVGVPAAECPGQGRLPRVANLLCYEQDAPATFLLSLLVYALLHAVNWSLFGLALAVPSRLWAIARRRRKSD